MHEIARAHTHTDGAVVIGSLSLFNNRTISLRGLVFSKLIQWNI